RERRDRARIGQVVIEQLAEGGHAPPQDRWQLEERREIRGVKVAVLELGGERAELAERARDGEDFDEPIAVLGEEGAEAGAVGVEAAAHLHLELREPEDIKAV